MKDIRKGYKVFEPDWTCRGFQYKVGETYEHKGDIKLCGNGFHFCVEASDCFNYYEFNSRNKVAEVEAIGLVKSGGDKSVTNKIRIVRELDWSEVLKLVNSGNRNSGYGNSGDENSGNWNSGFNNSGDGNSGNWNSGFNNSGNHNLGNMNSGRFNSGNFNSGDYNSTDCSNGVFCTEEPKIKIFDIQTDMTLKEWRRTEASQILYRNLRLNIWIYSEFMTDEEKRKHPKYKTTGGYLKTISFKEACANMWKKLTDEEKDVIKNIPNFNKNKFKQITGIEI